MWCIRGLRALVEISTYKNVVGAEKVNGKSLRLNVLSANSAQEEIEFLLQAEQWPKRP